MVDVTRNINLHNKNYQKVDQQEIVETKRGSYTKRSQKYTQQPFVTSEWDISLKPKLGRSICLNPNPKRNVSLY